MYPVPGDAHRRSWAADLPAVENPFPRPYVRRFATMIVDTATYLPALLDEIRQAGGTVLVRRFREGLPPPSTDHEDEVPRWTTTGEAPRRRDRERDSRYQDRSSKTPQQRDPPHMEPS